MQGVTHLEVFSSVFNMTKIKVTNRINKNTFAIYTPGYWISLLLFFNKSLSIQMNLIIYTPKILTEDLILSIA